MRGYVRGRLCEWDVAEKFWRYVDSNLPAHLHNRPCPQCGDMPTRDGHDACISNIPGASSACCGHGVHVGYVNWPNIPAPSGWWNNAYLIESE